MSQKGANLAWYRRLRWWPFFAWLIPMIIAFLSYHAANDAKKLAAEANQISRESNALTKQIAERAEEEKVSVFLQGAGNGEQNYDTFFDIRSDGHGGRLVVIPVRWSVVLANTGQTTVSFVSHQAYMTTDTSRRAVETEFMNEDGLATTLPITLEAGFSRELFLRVPMRVSETAYSRAQLSNQFTGSFALKDFEKFLVNNDIDIIGKNIRRLMTQDGTPSKDLKAYIITSNDEGNLVLELKSARNRYFSGQAHYYGGMAHRDPKHLRLPWGKSARITFKVEQMDSLPKKDGR